MSSFRRCGSEAGYGYRPDPSGHMVTSARHILGLGATPITSSVEDARPATQDQAHTSSCVGHAAGCAAATRMKAIGTPIALPSFAMIYKLARAIDLPVEQGELTDTGSMPNQAMRALTEWGCGITKEEAPLDETTINVRPRLDELEAAARVRLRGHYRINAAGPTLVEDVRRAIAQRFPVTFAVEVDQKFEDHVGSGVIGAPDYSKLLGGHYLYAVGYDTDSRGRTFVRFANSWGVEWGDRGIGTGDEAFMRGWRDVYVMNVEAIS